MHEIIQAAYDCGDYKTALKEWSPLAEQGDAAAQFSLGVMYDNGDGVTQDDAKAAKWFRMSAEQGNATAQFNLGVMYDTGEGVTQDDAKAAKWYRMAAKQDDAKAQNNLSVMYERGEGVTQDYVRAHMWANLANANGYGSAEKFRDSLAAGMTLDDIAKARTMARECLESDYKNCPE